MRAALYPIAAFLVLFAATSFVACGGDSGEGSDTSGGAGSPQDRMVPLAELDREVGAHPFDKQAGQVFWKPIRERAFALETLCDVRRTPLDSPAVSDDIHAAFEEATTKAPGVGEDFARASISLKRTALGPWKRPRAHIRSLRPTEGGVYMRNYSVHVDSPVLHEKTATLVRLDDLPEGEVSGKVGVFTGRAPAWDELEALAKRGVIAWVIEDTVHNETMASQNSYPQEVQGADGRTLPIPVIFAAYVNRYHIADAIDVKATWEIHVDQAPLPEGGTAEIISATLAGRDSSRKVIVTAGRSKRPVSHPIGSSCLALSTMLDVARVMCSVAARQPAMLPHCDVEFAYVIDGGTGYDFIRHLRKPGQTIVGVVDIDGVAPEDVTSKDVFLTLDGAQAKTALGRAFYGAAKAFGGASGAWRYTGVDTGLAPIPAKTAEACSQEVVPLLRVSGSTIACGGRSLRGTDLYPAFSNRLGGFTGAHPLVGSSADRLQKIVAKKVPAAVAVARLTVIAVARLAGAWSEAD